MTQYLTLEDVLFLIDDLGVGPVRDIGLLDFTDRPQAMRYAICIQCPVRDLCPDRTLQPRQDVCKRGHLADRYANGGCKVCQRDKQRGTTTPPDVTLEGPTHLREKGRIAHRASERAACWTPKTALWFAE